MLVQEPLRQKILDELSTQFSQDKIGMDEYEQRVKAVSNAKDDIELIAINSDIIPPARYQGNSTGNPSLRSSPGSSAIINYGDAPGHKDCVAIFSGSELNGEFLAPRRMDAVSIFGGIDIDLRKAAIPQAGMSIDAVAIFGGVNIVVPDGVRVQVDGVAIFGGYNRPQSSYNESGPLIKISGAAIFGGVDIKFKK